MLKFDENIFNLLDKIEKLSYLVNNKLKESSIDIDVINFLYENRNQILQELTDMKDENDWKSFLIENNSKFFKKIDDIKIIESENIEILSKFATETGKNLQNLSKNKNLLVYR
jgi:ribosomal protein S18